MLATSSVPYSVPTSLPWVPEACGVIFSHQACGLGASPFQVNSLRQLRPVPFGAVRAGGFDSELKLNQTSRPVRKQGGWENKGLLKAAKAMEDKASKSCIACVRTFLLVFLLFVLCREERSFCIGTSFSCSCGWHCLPSSSGCFPCVSGTSARFSM